MAQDKNVRFIRKNGRVIPIRADGPGKGSSRPSKGNRKEAAAQDAVNKLHKAGEAFGNKRAHEKKGENIGRFAGAAAGGILGLRGGGSLARAAMVGIGAAAAGGIAGRAIAKRTKKGKQLQSTAKSTLNAYSKSAEKVGKLNAWDEMSRAKYSGRR